MALDAYAEPRAVKLEAKTVQTPMGRWSYRVHGVRRREGAPDILLLHGLFTDSELWGAQVAPLARLGRVVALDLPGHGGSDVSPPFDLPQNAEALAAALPAMGIDRAICIGWSWGGALSLHLALRHPERVAAIVALDSSAEAQPRYRRLKYGLLVAILRRFGMTHWLTRSQIAPLMFSRQTLREHPDLVEEFVQRAMALPRDAITRGAQAVAIDAPGVLGRLGAIHVPVLIMCGSEDRGYPPAFSEHMASAIPGARLEWIEGAGHLSVLERPDEVNRFLVPFVAE